MTIDIQNSKQAKELNFVIDCVVSHNDKRKWARVSPIVWVKDGTHILNLTDTAFMLKQITPTMVELSASRKSYSTPLGTRVSDAILDSLLVYLSSLGYTSFCFSKVYGLDSSISKIKGQGSRVITAGYHMTFDEDNYKLVWSEAAGDTRIYKEMYSSFPIVSTIVHYMDGVGLSGGDGYIMKDIALLLKGQDDGASSIINALANKEATLENI